MISGSAMGAFESCAAAADARLVAKPFLLLAPVCTPVAHLGACALRGLKRRMHASRVASQLEAFRSGVQDVMPVEALSSFSEMELKVCLPAALTPCCTWSQWLG